MKQKQNVRVMTELALLMAIILIMAFTPLGYLQIGPLAVSFLVVPVAVGAVMLGVKGGAFLGLVFGLTSFWQALTGTSAFGSLLFQQSPILTFGQCVLMRVAMGALAGLICQVMAAHPATRAARVPVTCLAVPLLNTLFFMTYLAVVFSGTAAATYGFDGAGNLLLFLFASVGVNAVSEAVASLVVGTAVCGALQHAMKKA